MADSHASRQSLAHGLVLVRVQSLLAVLFQASESPLLVASAAGSVALPNLLKLAGLLKDHAHELVSGDQLPVEIDLSQEFAFRSVFSCPVSREQSSMTNPPWLLPCGHVLCKVNCWLLQGNDLHLLLLQHALAGTWPIWAAISSACRALSMVATPYLGLSILLTTSVSPGYHHSVP